MNDLFHNFHFLRPWLLVFLLLPLLLFFKKLKTGGNASSWADVCDKNLLNFLLVSNSGQRHFSVKKLIYTGLAVAAIAAAGPAWKKTEIPSLAVENPNMFVLSLAQDMQLTDITPSRLDRAKFMISDLAEHIPQGQFGLEVYSEEPYVITPIVDDVKLLKNLLPLYVKFINARTGKNINFGHSLNASFFVSRQSRRALARKILHLYYSKPVNGKTAFFKKKL